MDYTLVIVVAVALFFDFTNGFHDTANAIATSIATKALPPKLAVIGAAVLNFLGAFLSISVAATIAKGIIDASVISMEVILAGLVGAILWNLITWRFGMPTSSSHALIGGVIGSAVMAAGFGVVQWQGIEEKVLVPSIVAPALGIAGAFLITLLILRLIKRKSKTSANIFFKRLQIASAGFVAFTHGTNDAQKTMGIIALALLIHHPSAEFHVPLWVIVSSAAAMALGTYIGGWRIIHTLGHKLVHLEPPQGFAAETTTAGILFTTAHLGFPVSTTHTISGSIIGSGVATGSAKIRWQVVRHIVIAWLITIPLAALVGAAAELTVRLPGGSVIVLVLGGLAGYLIVASRNWSSESVAQFTARLAFLQKIRRKARTT